MEVFLGLLGTIWGILCLILFFKVWGMCNNVSKILELLEKKSGKEDDKRSQQDSKVPHNESHSQQKKVRSDVSVPTKINPWA